MLSTMTRLMMIKTMRRQLRRGRRGLDLVIDLKSSRAVCRRLYHRPAAGVQPLPAIMGAKSIDTAVALCYDTSRRAPNCDGLAPLAMHGACTRQADADAQ